MLVNGSTVRTVSDFYLEILRGPLVSTFVSRYARSLKSNNKRFIISCKIVTHRLSSTSLFPPPCRLCSQTPRSWRRQGCRYSSEEKSREDQRSSDNIRWLVGRASTKRRWRWYDFKSTEKARGSRFPPIHFCTLNKRRSKSISDSPGVRPTPNCVFLELAESLCILTRLMSRRCSRIHPYPISPHAMRTEGETTVNFPVSQELRTLQADGVRG